MDAYVEVLIRHVQDQGYVVIPKERVLKMSHSVAIDHMVLAMHRGYAGKIVEHEKEIMGRNYGREIIRSPAVAWEEVTRDDHKIIRSEIQLITPKREAT